MDRGITLTICTDNAAFGDTYEEMGAEIARILRETADRIERIPNLIESGMTLKDVNGNTVGSVDYGVIQ